MFYSRKAIPLIVVAAMVLTSISIVPGHYSALNEAVIVTTDKSSYFAGDTVRINVSVVGPLSAQFSTSCQCYFVVENATGGVVYDQRHHSYYWQVLTSMSAPPTKNFLFTWNQKDDSGSSVAVPGTYKVWGYVAGFYYNTDPPVAGNSKSISIWNEAFDLALSAGWNLVTSPLVGFGYKASTLPGLATGDFVAEWDSGTGAYGHTYIKNVSGAVQDFAVAPSTAYWIWVAAAKTLHLYGSVPTTLQTRHITLPAGGGWFTLGLASMSTTRHARDIFLMWEGDTIGSRLAMVASYNPTHYIPYTTYLPDLPRLNDFSLIPGQGYMCFATGSGTISYTP